MTRKKVIKLLRRFIHQFDGRDVEDAFVEDVLEAAADMLEQDARGWISVKDKMPSREGRYLVAVGNDFDDVCIAEYDGKEFGETVPEYDGLGHVFEDWDAIKFATHWAEMPCPPKEDADAKP